MGISNDQAVEVNKVIDDSKVLMRLAILEDGSIRPEYIRSDFNPETVSVSLDESIGKVRRQLRHQMNMSFLKELLSFVR